MVSVCKKIHDLKTGGIFFFKNIFFFLRPTRIWRPDLVGIRNPIHRRGIRLEINVFFFFFTEILVYRLIYTDRLIKRDKKKKIIVSFSFTRVLLRKKNFKKLYEKTRERVYSVR